jgi:hypothetical protein
MGFISRLFGMGKLEHATEMICLDDRCALSKWLRGQR